MAISSLDDRDESLEAHATVDVLLGQRLEAAVGLAVELHEDQVPDLQHVGIVLVDEVRRVAPSDPVAALKHMKIKILSQLEQHFT